MAVGFSAFLFEVSQDLFQGIVNNHQGRDAVTLKK
jgi:hypothetical protein